MNESLVCISPPAVEPVSLAEFKDFLEIPASDTSRDTKLASFLLAARVDCERYTRTKLVTQTWLLRRDSFPGVSVVYDGNGFPELRLPFPPFQSIKKIWYVDVAGAVQELTRDASYGNQLLPNFYGYQLEPGGGLIPGRVLPTWARPWPPNRLVPASMLVEFRCGYGGPVTVSTTADSAVLSASDFTFNPDDGVVLAGDKGLKITIPGAGPMVSGSASDLVTNVASVDGLGVATLADPAAAIVSDIQAWLGDPVPEPLRLAIMFHAQFFFEQGAVVDQEPPRIINRLRDSYRNLVS